MPPAKTSLSLSSVLKPKISRRHLSRYSWLPDVLRIEGSIVGRIIGPVLTLTIFATGVTYAWSIGKNVTLTNSVTPLLAVVVGLILVFRNSTSYDRYYEGRKDWGVMSSNIRNLARQIWINVCLPADANGKVPNATTAAAHLHKQKIASIRLCLAFAYAVKHHLRDEEGLQWDDYADILPESLARMSFGGFPRTASPRSMYLSYDAIPRSGKASSASTTLGSSTVEGHGQAAQSNPVTPLLSDSHRTLDVADQATLSLPIIIAHELSRYIFRFKRAGFLDNVGPAGTNGMNALIQSMIDQLTAMERIARTPIPVSYSIHLKQCVSLYLFSLPFTLVRDLGWGTVPVVTVVAFTLMGIEGIANEIEMPFGHDKSDLPLDRYCTELRQELFCIIDRLPEGGDGTHGFDIDDDED